MTTVSLPLPALAGRSRPTCITVPGSLSNWNSRLVLRGAVRILYGEHSGLPEARLSSATRGKRISHGKALPAYGLLRYPPEGYLPVVQTVNRFMTFSAGSSAVLGDAKAWAVRNRRLMFFMFSSSDVSVRQEFPCGMTPPTKTNMFRHGCCAMYANCLDNAAKHWCSL